MSTRTPLSRRSVLFTDECLLAAVFSGNDRMVFRHSGTHKKGRAQLTEIRLHAEAPTEIELLSRIQQQQETKDQ